jgi:pyruvate-ferredoxin/flavodoxin oxidoreductase
VTQLIVEMENYIRLQLVETMDISDIDAVETAIDENHDVDLTLSRLTGSLDKDKATQPIDPDWLKWALQIIAQLKHLKWSYTSGASGEGRAYLGMASGTDQSSAWASTFPYNPYPFPWVNHISRHAPSLAMGLFEGHMVKMAEGFKVIRTAELAIKNKYDQSEHDHFFAHFDWQQFSEEEYLLCPPLITVGAEGINVGSGLQSLSSSLLSGMPIKVLVLDNQPSPNPASLRKELGFITMAHRTAYVHQGSIANTAHLLSGYIEGLNYKGPALWSVYASSQPDHHSLAEQSQLAVESRSYPLLSFDPRRGTLWEECINLEGNPQIDQDWMSYSLDYTDEYGNQFAMETSLTYADWALTESSFSHHFKPTLADDESENTILLTEFIELDEVSKAGKIPFIWATHPRTNRLLKVEVSVALAKATQEQKDFWHTLKGLSGDSKVEVDTQAIADQAQAEMAQSITEGLMSMLGGDSSALSDILAAAPAIATAKSTVVAKKPVAVADKKPALKPKLAEKPKAKVAEKKQENAAAAHEPVWIETPDCTTCDECVEIAPAMFQYNEEKKAIVIDPTKGTFEEIVRSAEKCTAVIIHPGTPWNPDEPNLDQLIKRAEKFQ